MVSFASELMKAIRGFPVLVYSPRMFILGGSEAKSTSSTMSFKASPMRIPELANTRNRLRPLASMWFKICLSSALEGTLSSIKALEPLRQNKAGSSISFSIKNILTAVRQISTLLGGFHLRLILKLLKHS